MFNSLIKISLLGLLITAVVCMPAYAGGGGGEAKKSDSHGDGGHGNQAMTDDDPNRPQYVKISPLILPMIGDNGVEQIVSLVIVIEVSSRDVATEVISKSPRINDAFLTDLYGAIDRRERMRNGLLDVTYLKDRLTKLVIEIMGADKIKGVLVQGITQRPA
jgi:flagellar basal body-associated protein FliL